MKHFEDGTTVKWNWGSAEGTGRIVEKYTEEVEKTIKGTTVKRNASADEPAYLIEQDDGDRVLKSHSEIEKAG